MMDTAIARGTALVLMVMLAAIGAQADEYEGVTPGSDNPPPKAQRLDKSKRLVTWPGFQTLGEGKSRFFIQTTRPVSFDIRQSDKRVEVVIRKTKIHLCKQPPSARDTVFQHTRQPRLSTTQRSRRGSRVRIARSRRTVGYTKARCRWLPFSVREFLVLNDIRAGVVEVHVEMHFAVDA